MKICFIGAGSTVFLKNIVGDLFLTPEVPREIGLSLYDIDEERLNESRIVVESLDGRYNGNGARLECYLGPDQRRDAIRGADFVINMIQVGGYRPATVVDFEIPREFGLRQTIGDTLGIGGIFRGLRTIPVMLDLAADMEAVAPRAFLLNYTNPMAIATGAVLKTSTIRAVGLCHSVQNCAAELLSALRIEADRPRWEIAGINHMAWLLEIHDGTRDLYPEIKRRAAAANQAARDDPEKRHDDMVRYEMMRFFGYYVTESSEHNAEYTPYWIKQTAPELIEEFNIPLDEYPRRCEQQIADWRTQKASILKGETIRHERTDEYAAAIVSAVGNNQPGVVHANVMNAGYITNLPNTAVVEVATLVDGNGFHPTHVGELPPQCAALNRTNINVQDLTITAALTQNRDHIYHAALLDPHTAAELPPSRIVELCDRMLSAHKRWLPLYR